VYSALKEQGPSQADPLAARNYIRPGVLWWLIDRSGALNLNEARAENRKFEVPEDLEGSQHGAVVLIDEIDKGTEEVTEGLLEVLDTLRFSVPWTGEKVKSEPSADHSRRLTVITSNGAREMPAPFLRRCIVLSMKLPTDAADLGNWLRAREDAHQGGGPYAKEAVDAAIQVIVDHRKSTDSYRAGLAEFLYLLDAARDLAEKVEEQESLVKAFAPSVTTHKAEAALRT
jgi:soluble cytochrome b562